MVRPHKTVVHYIYSLLEGVDGTAQCKHVVVTWNLCSLFVIQGVNNIDKPAMSVEWLDAEIQPPSFYGLRKEAQDTRGGAVRILYSRGGAKYEFITWGW